MKPILDFWPIKSPPRKTQVKALQWLEANKDKKYLIMQGPVGCGKSVIAMTYSRFISASNLGDTYFLTPQKILQHQYEETFKEHNMVSLYGKNNYKCAFHEGSCEHGCSRNKGRPCTDCPWDEKKNLAVKSPNIVFNYKLALLYFSSETEFFTPRSLIVCDEAHTLEQHLVEFDCATITRELAISLNVKWLDKPTGIEQGVEWIKDKILPPLNLRLEDLKIDAERVMNQSHQSSKDILLLKQFQELSELYLDLCGIITIQKDILDSTRVLVSNELEISIKRLKGDYSFTKILDPFGDQFLMMSSTIINPSSFCKDLGIDEKEMAFLDLDSEFEIKNRPVYAIPQMNVNASWNNKERATERKDLLEGLNRLLDMHKDQSGIIHTGNFRLAEWAVSNIKSKHRIIHHNPKSEMDRDAAIKSYLMQAESVPTLLISPSITEGLDLINDLGRFAIFLKVPYMNLVDQWVKRRMEMSGEWYQRQAVIAVIQGGGRIVRSPEDSGTTYILDSNWLSLYNRVHPIIPQWWKDAYTEI